MKSGIKPKIKPYKSDNNYSLKSLILHRLFDEDTHYLFLNENKLTFIDLKKILHHEANINALHFIKPDKFTQRQDEKWDKAIQKRLLFIKNSDARSAFR